MLTFSFDENKKIWYTLGVISRILGIIVQFIIANGIGRKLLRFFQGKIPWCYNIIKYSKLTAR